MTFASELKLEVLHCRCNFSDSVWAEETPLKTLSASRIPERNLPGKTPEKTPQHFVSLDCLRNIQEVARLWLETPVEETSAVYPLVTATISKKAEKREYLPGILPVRKLQRSVSAFSLPFSVSSVENLYTFLVQLPTSIAMGFSLWES